MKYTYLMDLLNSDKKVVKTSIAVTLDKKTLTASATFTFDWAIKYSQLYVGQYTDNDEFIQGIKTHPIELILPQGNRFSSQSSLKITHALDSFFLEEIGVVERKPRPHKVLQSIMENVIFDKEI